ncbi:unnamed protein product [Coregonus sp. 'balchen']|nr:unnamed protein product [Coregonus sp. 'balchen']
MDRLICALLGSYILLLVLNKSLTVDATENSWNMAETRRVRSVNVPAPINCKMKMWSSWTPCNSCTDKKFRFRYMEQASQFGGRQCLDSQWEELACPTAQADCEQVDYRQDKCSTLLPIPGAGRGTQGFNILTGEFVDHVLDPQYYGGQCEYVYNGEWRKLTYDAFCENLHYNEDEKNYRKPYNFHSYRFMAQATSEGSSEYYEDMATFLKARKTEDSFNLGVTVGIQYVEFGIAGNVETEFLNNLTKYTNQELGFIRLQSKVQTAQFKMRSEGLMLYEDMYLSLMELPEEKYDFGLYSRFLNTYGTHYVTQGIMGGTLEYVAVVNKTAMEKSNINAGQLKGCLGGSIGISSPLGKSKQVEVGGKLEVQGCEGIGFYEKGSSGGLLAIRDPDTYRKWGLSLKYNPTLIEYETLPIFELVRLSTAGDHVGARTAHLRRAWEEYLLQFNSCRCAPCRHDGIPVLSQTSCHCICKQGFRGEACEDTLRKGSTTDGAWSCWGAWSSCQSGSKTRRRSCDNPRPDGGAACLGSSSQNQRC